MMSSDIQFNDVSLLYIIFQSIIVALCLSHEFLSLPFCVLRLYADGIYFSTHDVNNCYRTSAH